MLGEFGTESNAFRSELHKFCGRRITEERRTRLGQLPEKQISALRSELEYAIERRITEQCCSWQLQLQQRVSDVSGAMGVAQWLLTSRTIAVQAIQGPQDKAISHEDTVYITNLLCMLNSVSSAREIVTAYDLVRWKARRANSHLTSWKCIALMVREILVIRMCHSHGLLNSLTFTELVTKFPERSIENELLSELSKAYTTVCILGLDRDMFNDEFSSFFPGISLHDSEVMFAAYAACVRKSPYTSEQAERNGKPLSAKTELSRSHWLDEPSAPEATIVSAARSCPPTLMMHVRTGDWLMETSLLRTAQIPLYFKASSSHDDGSDSCEGCSDG